MSVKVLSH